MNEVANLCERVGANVDSVRKGIGSDARIGNRFLFPGVGYGGSCFPKDVQALARTAQENSYDFKVLSAVMDVNDRQKLVIVDKIVSKYGSDLTGKKFALWGLAFKPNTDDIREAPALYIIEELVKMGAAITAYDPEAMSHIKALIGNKISYAATQYDALTDADALIIVTEWSVFRTPDFIEIEKRLKSKTIFDGRNVYELTQMQNLGYYYNSIGRKIVNA